MVTRRIMISVSILSEAIMIRYSDTTQVWMRLYVYNVASVNICTCDVCARVRVYVYVCEMWRYVSSLSFSRVYPYIILVMRVCRFNVQLINYTG